MTQFRPGDKVYAEVDGGGLAEYASVPEASLCLKPANLTFEQAAAVPLPLPGDTALQGLRDRGPVRPGQKVLINGASGGVGTFAVQIAKGLGADVTGVCSTRNVDLGRSIGADHVIDYTHEHFVDSEQRYDVIFDVAGSRSLSEGRRALTPKGTLVLSSGTGGRVFGPLGRYVEALASSPLVSQTLRVHSATRRQQNLRDLKDLTEAGAVRPVIDRTYRLHETPEAICYFAEEHARAKIVISI